MGNVGIVIKVRKVEEKNRKVGKLEKLGKVRNIGKVEKIGRI